MKTITTVYPEFVPNQVLTNTQLNQLREHLDQQTRLSRIRLTGTGIVCGLDWHVVVGPDSLTVTEGFGITSDGYMIQLPQTEYFHVREYLDPDKDDDENPNYSLWRSEGDIGGQIALWELLEEAVDATDDQPGSMPYADFERANKVIVLYLERDPVKLDSCLVTECDNKGLNVNLNVRVLFVDVGNVARAPKCDPAPALVRVPRFHTRKALADITTAASIDATYREIVADGVDELRAAIIAAADKYRDTLGVSPHTFDAIRDRGLQVGQLVDLGEGNQYYYDALKDIAQAYNEFATQACELETSCCRDLDFPRHLMLGETEFTGGFRHGFYPAPLRNVFHMDFTRVRRLLGRIDAMDEHLEFPDLEEVRIVPSHTETHFLGQRAMPFYYAFRFLDWVWQPQGCCTTARLWSYHADGSDDLDSDYNACSFLRIEGHLGAECNNARRAIENVRDASNLEFDVCCAYLQDRQLDEDEISDRIGDHRARRRQIIAELAVFIADNWPDMPDDSEFREAIKEAEDAAMAGLRDWRNLRNARELHCTTDSLQTAYQRGRDELLCAVHGLNAHLIKLLLNAVRTEPENAPWAGEPGLQEGALDVLPRWIALGIAHGTILPLSDSRGLALNLPGGRSPIPSAAVGVSRDVDDPATIYMLGVISLLSAAWGSINTLVEDFLPGDLKAFHLESFTEQYDEVVELLRSIWLTWTSFANSAPPSSDDGFPHPPASIDDAMGSILHALRRCLHDAVARPAHDFDDLRGRDLSLFRNLAVNVNGLEHLGGVEKGGTFVLVVDQDRVAADFSLAGQLRCCCESEPESMCLPPVALPDYRIAVLEWDAEREAYEPVKLEIEVLANDYDPNRPSDDGERLKIVVSDESQFGAELTSDGRNVIYKHDSPRPGLVDRFDYKLELHGEQCAGTSNGHVLVMHSVRVDAEPQPGVTGIHGSVIFDHGGPAGSAHVSGSGPQHIEMRADAAGQYLFAGIPPGNYRLQASVSEDFSELVDIAVLENQISEAPTLIIPTATQVGGIRGTVTLNEKVIGGAIVRDLDSNRGATTQPDGGYAIADLPPATYRLQASFQGIASDVQNVPVVANGVSTADFHLFTQDLGDLLIRVTNFRLLAIDEASVTVDQEDGDFFAENGQQDDSGLFILREVPLGKYTVKAAAPGFESKLVESVEPGSDILHIVLTGPDDFFVAPRAAFVTTVAEADNLPVSEASEKVREVYLARHVTYAERFHAAGKDRAVADTVTYKAAREFLTDTVTDAALDDASVIEAYADVANRAVRTIKQARPDRAEAYRDALAAVSLAFVDRLSVTDHKTLGPEAKQAVTQMALMLDDAGVDMPGLRADWNERALRDQLHMESAQAIGKLLK